MADTTQGGGDTPPPPGPGTPAAIPQGDGDSRPLYGDAPPKATDNGQPDTRTPKGFFARLIDAAKGNFLEATKLERSALRGVAQVPNALIKTATSAVAAADRATGLGEMIQPGYNKQYDANGGRSVVDAQPFVASQDQVEQVIGRKSDDLLAGAVDDFTRFGSGVALAQATGLGPLASFAAGDLAVENPDEGNFLTMVGHILPKPAAAMIESLFGHDSQAVPDDAFLGRLKNTAGNVIGGKLIEGVFAVGAVMWARRIKATPGVAPELKATAEKVEETSTPKVRAIVDGTAPPSADEAVSVKAQPDGTYTLEQNPPIKAPATVGGRPSTGVQNFNTAVDSHFGVGPGEDLVLKGTDGTPLVRVALSNKGGDVVELKSIESLTSGSRSGNATKVMQDLTRMADEHGVTISLQASPFGEKAIPRENLRDFYRKFGFEQTKYGDANMVRRPGEGDVGFREVGTREAQPIASPVFTDQAEAMTQAATINPAVANERRLNDPTVGQWSPEEVKAHFDAAATLAKSGTDDAFQTALGKTTFNVDWFASDEALKSNVAALSQQWKDAFREAQKTDGVTHEFLLGEARRLARQYGMFEYADVFKKTAGDLEDSVVNLVLGNRLFEQMGQQVADLGQMMVARPGDPGLLANARVLLNRWQQLGLDVAGSNSNAGRILESLKTRGTEDFSKIKFRGDIPDAQSLQEASTAVQEARTAVNEARSGSPAGAAAGEGGTVNTTDTNASRADEFMLARMRKRAEKVQNALKKIGSDYPVFELDAKGAADRAAKINEAAAAQAADPLAAPTAAEKAAVAADQAKRRSPANPIEALSTWLEGAEAEVEKIAKRVETNATARDVKARKAQGTAFDAAAGNNETPFDALRKRQKIADKQEAAAQKKYSFMNEAPKPKGAPQPPAPEKIPAFRITDEMSDDAVETAMRQFVLAGGQMRNVQALAQSMKYIQQETTFGAKALNHSTKFFMNALISGARTMQTIVGSGAVINGYEASLRALSGIATGNIPLAREGLDQMWAMGKYALENARGASAAFRLNRSILDPSPNLYASSGPVGDIIGLPGRAAGTLDEFTRQTAYRAYMRAKALRLARSQGLTGEALYTQVEKDVAASIDAQTGIGLNEEAAKFAGVPTLSDPLGHGSLGGDLAALTARHPVLNFTGMMFLRPNVNTFRYMAKSTPGINLFVTEARDALLGRSGPEAAAMAYTRTVAAGSLYYGAYNLFTNSQLTGRAPKDPKLRAAWLKDHQEYSVRVGGNWHSYRRFEPFASILGTMADGLTAMHESEDTQTQGNIATAAFGAIMANWSNKSWMQTFSDFISAMQDENINTTSKYIGSLVAGFEPQAIKQFNQDPAYRDTRGHILTPSDNNVVREFQGLVDQVLAQTPGFSDKLPAKYNYVGEPQLRSGGLWNRRFSIISSRAAKNTPLETAMDQYGIKLSPPNPKLPGHFDLFDPGWRKNGKLPYERWMDLIREGWDGRPGLRSQLDSRMADQDWKDASSGSTDFPGGLKGQLLASVKQSQEKAAFEKVLDEYGQKFRDAYDASRRFEKLSTRQGQKAADSLTALTHAPR